MFRLFMFVLRWTIRFKVLILAVATGMAIAFGLQLRGQYRSWGRIPADQQRTLRGDDLVAQPDLVETRTLVIDAPPSAVWPWLAQLGYGRGGWYSFSQLERPWRMGGGSVGASADIILEAYQDLAVGDLVPTDLAGGFVASVVEPDSALVLFLDDVRAREQFQEMAAAESKKATDAASDMTIPPFKVSWAFVLESVGKDRTRLTERMRMHIDGLDGMQRRGVPILRLGIFAFMRSQMLGIAQRAEQASLARPVGAPAVSD